MKPCARARSIVGTYILAVYYTFHRPKSKDNTAIDTAVTTLHSPSVTKRSVDSFVQEQPKNPTEQVFT
jgi:hypothetical protein